MTEFISRENIISDYLLAECRERGEVLTHLKLQKLLYYSQAWFLAIHDVELFEEDFKAWVHGPVLVSQYHRFKQYGWKPLEVDIERPNLNEREVSHLDEVVDIFGTETAVSLELMTHRERPWLDARGDALPHEPSSAVISKISMKDYYRSVGGND